MCLAGRRDGSLAAAVGIMPWWALTLASFHARERRCGSRWGCSGARLASARCRAARMAGASACWLWGR
ncbi:hypothetical protein D3C76_1327550 [compost metagenome]